MKMDNKEWEKKKKHNAVLSRIVLAQHSEALEAFYFRELPGYHLSS